METGASLGSFAIVGPLGAGGMGIVYRARDAKLHRDVALKLLPPPLASDRQAIQRLNREARLLASLNHPNIATIHGVDAADGTTFLVLELIEGQSLAERLTSGALPLREALRVAQQVADALEATHAAGILHRDLKPSNIILTPRGLVKILDFGIAQTFGRSQPSGWAADESTTSNQNVTGPAFAGTTPYMSPEQVRGERLDQRSDIWAFGCVLYETLTAHRAFAGATALETIAGILEHDPGLDGLPPATPPDIRSLIRRCLNKDRIQRLHDIGDARIEIEETLARVSTPAAAREAASIAVLPFLNIGGDPENDYFGDGLAEELIDGLGRIKGLRVAARTSAFEFKTKKMDVRRIGEQLGVETILDGSVRTAGERVRVMAQLVSVRNGCQLWSQRFDGDMRDVFAIQDEIASAIVDKLRVEFGEGGGHPLVKRYTENLDAYHLYMKGRFYWAKRHEVGLHESLEFFRKATEIDPGHALAHTGIADVYWSLGLYMARPPVEVFPVARAAALRALTIDEELGAAHTALGVIRCFFDWDWAAAEREFHRAIELEPTSAFAHGYYAGLLTLTGRRAEALEQARRAQQVDPFSATARGLAALTLGLNEQYDEAAQVCRRGLDVEPDSFTDGWLVAWIDDRCGRYESAVERFDALCERPGRHRFLLPMLAHASARAGDARRAEDILAELEAHARETFIPALHFAWVHEALEHHDLATEWLERAYAERTNPASFLMYGRRDQLLRRMGVPVLAR
jgi:eukaryotic-like serine/threonine-protein kinase